LFFSDTLRRIIHHLNYFDRVSMAKPLAIMLRECMVRESFEGDLVLPVPLHPARRRERGFNQAELLARGLGRPVDVRILRRRKNTSSQTGLTRSERVKNLAGAFEVRGEIRGTVIVVDDVYTTGATVNEIARTLRRSGAERVEVLTIARVANNLYRPDDMMAGLDVSSTQ
jgi:ComF family protein